MNGDEAGEENPHEVRPVVGRFLKLDRRVERDPAAEHHCGRESDGERRSDDGEIIALEHAGHERHQEATEPDPCHRERHGEEGEVVIHDHREDPGEQQLDEQNREAHRQDAGVERARADGGRRRRGGIHVAYQ